MKKSPRAMVFQTVIGHIIPATAPYHIDGRSYMAGILTGLFAAFRDPSIPTQVVEIMPQAGEHIYDTARDMVMSAIQMSDDPIALAAAVKAMSLSASEETEGYEGLFGDIDLGDKAN